MRKRKARCFLGGEAQGFAETGYAKNRKKNLSFSSCCCKIEWKESLPFEGPVPVGRFPGF